MPAWHTGRFIGRSSYVVSSPLTAWPLAAEAVVRTQRWLGPKGSTAAGLVASYGHIGTIHACARDVTLLGGKV